MQPVDFPITNSTSIPDSTRSHPSGGRYQTRSAEIESQKLAEPFYQRVGSDRNSIPIHQHPQPQQFLLHQTEHDNIKNVGEIQETRTNN